MDVHLNIIYDPTRYDSNQITTTFLIEIKFDSNQITTTFLIEIKFDSNQITPTKFVYLPNITCINDLVVFFIRNSM